MKKSILVTIMAATMLIAGCSTVKSLANKGLNVAASIGTNVVNALDITQPLVQDPAQPDDPTAVIVNPALVSAAQGAATTFGGPYGVPIAAVIGILAGVVGTITTQKRRTSR